MASRTKQELVDRAAWWRRKPWPVVILGLDPAEESGGTIALPKEAPGGMGQPGGPYLWRAEEVNIYTRGVEGLVTAAVNVARQEGLQLVVCLEEWGSGGRLGIKTWLGMGAAAGAWKRTVALLAREDCADVLTPSRCLFSVPQTRWRSRMIEECGVRGAEGGFRRYTPEQWKKAAGDTVREMFPYVRLAGANAAESALIAAYAARSDELGRLLPSTYLRKHGFEPLPPLPKQEKRKSKPAKVRIVEKISG